MNTLKKRNYSLDLIRVIACLMVVMIHAPLPIEKADEIFDSLPEQSEASPLDIVIRREDYHKLLACIEKLGEKNKSIFRLKYLLEYSNAEIAKLLNMSSTKEVSAKLYREKKMLMKMMGGDPNDENRRKKRDAF